MQNTSFLKKIYLCGEREAKVSSQRGDKLISVVLEQGSDTSVWSEYPNCQLLEYYEQNLCHKIFKYELNNKINIEVIFYIEGLCHLLGIQHVYDNDKRYQPLRWFLCI